ncbi:hypothetical protein [Actibacterium sp. 188UL27-1]|uniref:hypothetical protein n=1 Tax=Actibacterium sp. 188UL27-1 TaxID=2786961 RepID=UPI00195C57A3|nr:hypothetical protein [Actibacterium sp. 188UL27-1]MBM7067900.1 hypothetical protein [Actibacterium sp. 188UL27-1]
MFGWFRKSKVDGRSDRALKNDKIRAALGDYGDSGAGPREVVHFAYPAPDGSGAGRDDLMLALAYLNMEFIEDEVLRPGAILRETREVASDDFDRHTEELAGVFLGQGWHYDGWECTVQTKRETGQ